MKKLSKKIMSALAAFALVGTVSVSLASCGESNEASNDGIITAYGCEPENALLPSNTTETCGGDVLDLILAGLVRFDQNGDAINEMADSITTDDSQNYTVKLKDWKWSDDTTVTAQDYVDSWNFTANAKNAQLNSSFFDVIDGYDAINPEDEDATAALTGSETLSGLSVIDDKTFTIKLTEPSSTFKFRLGQAAYYPIPSSALNDVESFGESPIASGPYKLSAWNHQQDIQLVPNDKYTGGINIANKGVTFKIYTDTDAGYTAIQSGQLDVMDAVPASQSQTFLTDSSVSGHTDESTVIETFAIPTYLKHFAEGEEGNLRRQAISLSIDRQTLIDTILNGRAVPASSFSSPSKTINGSSKDIEGNDVLKYDPEKAQELWSQANAIAPWGESEVFKISFNSNGGGAAIYEAITNSIAKSLGIDAQPDAVVDFKTLRSAANAHTLQYAIRNGWQPDYPSVDNYLQPIFTTNGASNDSRYSNEEFDSLILAGSQSVSIEDANKKFDEAQAVLMKDLPNIPLYSRNVNGVTSKGVNGYALNWKGVPEFYSLSK